MLRVSVPTRAALVVLEISCGAVQLAAQAAPNVEVRFIPESPPQGTFVVVAVRVEAGEGEPARAIEGSLAGQLLHFSPVGGEFRSMGAIPIGARGNMAVTLSVTSPAGDTMHRLVRLPVAGVEFPTEQLTVDPRFTDEPDSALAERIRREARAARQVSLRSHDTPRLWTEAFERPAGGEITSAFGTGRVFNRELQSRHWGVDFDGETGDPVRAANRGVVALVGNFYYAGNVIYLDHGEGVVTVYMHLSDTLVARGDTVEAGQVIGRIGATGRVTGPHLHWAGRYGTVTANPLSLLELSPTVLRTDGGGD